MIGRRPQEDKVHVRVAASKADSKEQLVAVTSERGSFQEEPWLALLGLARAQADSWLLTVSLEMQHLATPQLRSLHRGTRFSPETTARVLAPPQARG